MTFLLLLWMTACGDDDTTDTSPPDASLDTSSEDMAVDVSVLDSTVFDAPINDDGDTPDAEPPLVPENISPSLDQALTEHGLIGVAAGVTSTRGILALGASGVRRRGTATEVGLDDRWHLGSLGKAMTATVAADVIEGSSLEWQTPVESVFSSFASQIDSSLRSVSLRELLSHRSGLTSQYVQTHSSTWSRLWELRQPVTGERAFVAQELLTNPPAFPPRAAFHYSNGGYMVAGALLETSTGTSWESLIQTRLFDRLGMSSCGFGSPATEGMTDAPWGYRNGDEVPPGRFADNPEAFGPAGTVHCNLRDYAKFLALHLQAYQGDATPILTGPVIRNLHAATGFAPRSPTEDYALGWTRTERDWAMGPGGQKLTLTHNGTNSTFTAMVWMGPYIDRAYFAVINEHNDESYGVLDEIIFALIQRFP